MEHYDFMKLDEKSLVNFIKFDKRAIKNLFLTDLTDFDQIPTYSGYTLGYI